jgi:hypothetical protein
MPLREKEAVRAVGSLSQKVTAPILIFSIIEPFEHGMNPRITCWIFNQQDWMMPHQGGQPTSQYVVFRPCTSILMKYGARFKLSRVLSRQVRRLTDTLSGRKKNNVSDDNHERAVSSSTIDAKPG